MFGEAEGKQIWKTCMGVLAILLLGSVALGICITLFIQWLKTGIGG